jgi:hypothetical protein
MPSLPWWTETSEYTQINLYYLKLFYSGTLSQSWKICVTHYLTYIIVSLSSEWSLVLLFSSLLL